MDENTALSQQRSRTTWLITAAVAIGILSLLAYGFWSQRSLDEGPAPDFTLSLFDGGEISLADLRRRVVVVNFWASWCTPCREEAPVLENIWQDYKDDDVFLVGVNIKDARDNALAFIEKFDITYPNGPDPYGRISGSFRVYRVPETFVITRDGEIAKRFIGAVTEDELRSILDELLR